MKQTCIVSKTLVVEGEQTLLMTRSTGPWFMMIIEVMILLKDRYTVKYDSEDKDTKVNILLFIQKNISHSPNEWVHSRRRK